MTTQYCSNCGTEVELTVRFCTRCGTKVAASFETNTRSRPGNLPASKRSLPILVLVIGVILLIGGSAVYLLNRPNPSEVVTLIPDDQDQASIPYPEVARISLVEARARFDAGTAVIVDVRPREDYETLHVLNAISLPLGELAARYEELPLEAEILTYCT